MSTVTSFKDNNHGVNRDEYCMKRFFEYLKKLAQRK